MKTTDRTSHITKEVAMGFPMISRRRGTFTRITAMGAIDQKRKRGSVIPPETAIDRFRAAVREECSRALDGMVGDSVVRRDRRKSALLLTFS